MARVRVPGATFVQLRRVSLIRRVSGLLLLLPARHGHAAVRRAGRAGRRCELVGDYVGVRTRLLREAVSRAQAVGDERLPIRVPALLEPDNADLSSPPLAMRPCGY